MTVIASPPPVQAPFQQGNINDQFASHHGQFRARPSRQLVGSNPSHHNFVNSQDERDDILRKQNLTNGHAAGDIAVTGANHHPSPGQREILRYRNENQKLPHRPRAQITRTQTDFGPNNQVRPSRAGAADEVGELRHGWEDEYNSAEFLGLLNSVSSHKFLVVLRSYYACTDFAFRLSTCTLRTNDTRPGESLRIMKTSSLQRNGATRTDRRPSRRLWYSV